MNAIFSAKLVAAVLLSMVASTISAAAQSPPDEVDSAPVWSSRDGHLYLSSYVSDVPDVPDVPDALGLFEFGNKLMTISKPWNPYKTWNPHKNGIVVCKPQMIQQRYDVPGG
jgi:hypothetical protein